MKINKQLIGSASLLTVGVLFGLSAVIAKYLTEWLNPYQVVEYRFLVAFIGTVIILLLSRKKLKFGKLDKRTLFYFSVTFPISVIFFTLAIFNTSVSLAVFSFYIATLLTSFAVGKIYFNEDITKHKRIALIFIILAVISFTDPFEQFTLGLGFIFGLISGVFQTIASSFQKIVAKTTNRIGLLLIQTLAGIVIAMIAILFSGASLLPTLPTQTLFVVLAFGIIFLAISYLFLVGFKYSNLNVGSILVSSELFFGPFFAFILLSERLNNLEILGGLLTAVAVYYANKREVIQ